MIVVNVSNYGGLEKAKRRGVTYCGRPSALGNHAAPLLKEEDRAKVIGEYRQWLLDMIAENDDPVMDALRELNEDTVLGCWCKPRLCHADVIVEVWTDLKAKGVI